MSWIHFDVVYYGCLNHELCVESSTVVLELRGRLLFVGKIGVYEFSTQSEAEEAWHDLLHRLEANETMINLPYEFEDYHQYCLRTD